MENIFQLMESLWISCVLEIGGTLHTFSAKISATCQPHVQFYDFEQSLSTGPGEECKNDFILLNFFKIKKFRYTSICFCQAFCGVLLPLFFLFFRKKTVAKRVFVFRFFFTDCFSHTHTAHFWCCVRCARRPPR